MAAVKRIDAKLVTPPAIRATSVYLMMDERRRLGGEPFACVHELPAVVVDDGKGGAGAHFGKTCTRGLDGGLQQSVGPAVPIDGHGAQKGCSERGGRKDGERLTGRVSE